MRDNHDGMPELLGAYEHDGHFFGAVAVTLGSECRHFEFGLPRSDYTALQRILQSRPFDQLPGLRYRYFISFAISRIPGTERAEVSIRVEQGRTSRHFDYEVPFSLASNLLWFARLKDFAAASHINAPKLNIGNA